MIRRPPRSPLFPYPTLFRSYDQKAFPAEARRNALLPVVAGSDTNGALRIHQDVTLYASELDAGKSVTHTLAPGRRAYLFVSKGGVAVNGQALGQSDAAAIEGETLLEVRGAAPSEVLLIDLP